MADLKNALFDYLAQRHFDLMSPDVRDRFDDYVSRGSFAGNMKEWNTRYNGRPLVDLATTMTDANDWEMLYDACQQTFQGMNEAKAPSFGYGSDYNGATRDFIAEWFGNNTKTFTVSKATSGADAAFVDLENWLRANKGGLEIPLRDAGVFTPEYKYDDFVKDLHNKKYNTNKDKFRDKLEALVGYIKYYTANPDREKLPINVAGGPVPDTPVAVTGLSSDSADWYAIPDKTAHIAQFKAGYARMFDVLLTNSTIRNKFLEKAQSPVKEVLETAIAKTDYENKESKDYVPPMPLDEKNLGQKIKKWKDDTYENHFRRFFEHSRGARTFFSPQCQNIMKGLDKAGVKPTDGLDGILSKKDDAKLQNVINQDPDTRDHFKWFTERMETIKKEMPDAYEGALRNGHQLRAVAIRLITTTKKADVEKAKTALEVLSVAKYGLTCSRRLNALNEATKDMSILSDGGLSWNKNEGIQFVTKAMDKTAGLAIRGVGLLGTGVHNFIQHRRTKIGNNIKKHDNLRDAYQQWRGEDIRSHNNLRAENTALNVTGKLADLDNPTRGAPYLTNGFQINETTMGTKDAPGPLRAAMDAAITAGATDVTVPGYGTVPLADLQNDVDIYEDAHGRQQKDVNWRDNNPDVIHDLIAHWDMLESYGKTHSFTLGSMAVKRRAMFARETNGKTHAQNLAADYYRNFGALRT